jgi:hypothetical protein
MSMHFPAEPEKMLRQSRSIWQEAGNPEGREMEAEERRAARAI